MSDPTPRRDYRGIITADTLRAWTGTDADLARSLGVARQAVTYARRVHGIAAPVNGRYGPRPGLSRSVCTAIVKEARRRGCTVAEVLLDLGVWADSAEGPEVGNA